MAERTVEDRLREEYFRLLPDLQRVVEEIETTVRHCLLPMTGTLDRHERLVVKSRVKDCESAINKLRKREGRIFDADQVESYTLTSLKDLAAVRVLAFPRSRWLEANNVVRQFFSTWISDPIPSDRGDEVLAYKYYGHSEASAKFRAEVQIVPMLIGLFWDVEHSAVYKLSPMITDVPLAMKDHNGRVIDALNAFDVEFERVILLNPLR